MARPFTASDDDILNAAQRVLLRRGADAFSIAEVANEIGLSRTAIILRFSSTKALKVKVLSRSVERFIAALEPLPKSPGGDSLLHLAAFIGTHIDSREGSVRFFANFTSNLRDRELVKLETRRGQALADVISSAMPPVAIDHESAVIAFRAYLTGSIFTWLALDDADSCRYIVLRTKEWLTLTGIAFSEHLVEELISQPTSARKKPSVGPRSNIVRALKPARSRRPSTRARRRSRPKA